MLEMLLSGYKPGPLSLQLLHLKIASGNTSSMRLQLRNVSGYVIHGTPGNEVTENFRADTGVTVFDFTPSSSTTDVKIYIAPRGIGLYGTCEVVANADGADRLQAVKEWSGVSKYITLCFSSKLLTTVPDTAPNSISFARLFTGCTIFNQDLSGWDTSHVTGMRNAFASYTAFNQPLNTWDTSSVTDMYGLFTGCSAFNQPLNNWNTANVTTMNNMFYNCSAFNQALNNWNTANVTNMSYMFYGCTVFNQPLNTWITASVTTMLGMFGACLAFNQPLNSWNTSNVTNMSNMFVRCSAYTYTISAWNISKVTTIDNMFNSCSVYNANLSGMIFKSTVTRVNYDVGATAWITANKPKFTGI